MIPVSFSMNYVIIPGRNEKKNELRSAIASSIKYNQILLFGNDFPT